MGFSDIKTFIQINRFSQLGLFMIDAKAKTQKIDESIEMVKVHIFSENLHEKHTSAITNAYAFFLGIFIVLFSFFVEKVIPLYAFGVGAAILLVGTIYERYLVEKAFTRDMRKTSELIEQVKAGRELPELANLLKKNKK
jgi:hypothetical protein